MVRLDKALLFCVLIISATASVPSFCKCTCFSNSTIIPLSSHSPSQSPDKHESRASLVGCVTCNKAFCLSQRLPICKDAEEKDVNTVCFQRDSRQDKIVVLTFITGTLGLLAWAGVKQILEKRELQQNDTHGYSAVDSP
ncbi:hypothetical protein OnM2_077013 [Erysiphe neolycopersici]|uniref:Uncharacterized protein n=1 Tax=Erysiphe neolycopersici TaxID=212602 RepID=A0A420HHX9_9PEZI|nr:hypothetical protein OnM2_077013 [Erysiphe neolycopersici]